MISKKKKKKRTRKCLFEYKRRQKKKIISVQMKPVREKESVRERVKGESVEEKR